MSNDAMIIDDNNVVGAGLVPAHAVVPAHDVVLSDDGSIVGGRRTTMSYRSIRGQPQGLPLHWVM